MKHFRFQVKRPTHSEDAEWNNTAFLNLSVTSTSIVFQSKSCPYGTVWSCSVKFLRIVPEQTDQKCPRIKPSRIIIVVWSQLSGKVLDLGSKGFRFVCLSHCVLQQDTFFTGSTQESIQHD